MPEPTEGQMPTPQEATPQEVAKPEGPVQVPEIPVESKPETPVEPQPMSTPDAGKESAQKEIEEIRKSLQPTPETPAATPTPAAPETPMPQAPEESLWKRLFG